jgi:hypothetical protein
MELPSSQKEPTKQSSTCLEPSELRPKNLAPHASLLPKRPNRAIQHSANAFFRGPYPHPSSSNLRRESEERRWRCGLTLTSSSIHRPRMLMQVRSSMRTKEECCPHWGRGLDYQVALIIESDNRRAFKLRGNLHVTNLNAKRRVLRKIGDKCPETRPPLTRSPRRLAALRTGVPHLE